MEFFGLTMYGPQNCIADMMKDQYKTPTNKEAVTPLMEKIKEYSTLPKTVSTGTGFISLCYIFDGYLLNTECLVVRDPIEEISSLICYLIMINRYYMLDNAFIKTLRIGCLAKSGANDVKQ